MAYPIEVIPDDSHVYRQVLPHERKVGNKKRRFPSEYHFELRIREKGLSVHWDKYITVEKIYLLLSLTNNSNKKFLNHTAFKVFRYPVKFLRSIEKIEDVVHTPNFYGDPSPIGKPNNRAHADVLYQNDMEIFVKLRDYCDEEYDYAHCKFDVNSINEKVEELKSLFNDNEFHKK